MPSTLTPSPPHSLPSPTHQVSYTHDDYSLFGGPEDVQVLAKLGRLRKLSLVMPYESSVTLPALVTLTQLRLLSLSPAPGLTYAGLLSLAR